MIPTNALEWAGPALKVVLTPVLIGAASLAGRRWGTAVSGWLVGLPLTSGPVALFLTLEHGDAFAAAAAAGILAGTISQAAFSLAYAWLATRLPWPPALGGATIAFAAATLALSPLVLPVVFLFLLAVAVLTLTVQLLPPSAAARSGVDATPRWDLPARMVFATGFVVLLTGLAPVLGAHLTGLLSPFPLYAAILAAFAHSRLGAAPATAVLRGLLFGLYGFAAFFLVLALLLEPARAAFAFAVAAAVGLVVQGGSLWLLRRAQVP